MTQKRKVDSQAKKPTIAYKVFKYRQQLGRRNIEYIKLSKTKLSITDALITKSILNINECRKEDLKIIKKQLQFKSNLISQINRLRKLNQLGVKNAKPNMESTDL